MKLSGMQKKSGLTSQPAMQGMSEPGYLSVVDRVDLRWPSMALKAKHGYRIYLR
jgi:hypothetical protein